MARASSHPYPATSRSEVYPRWRASQHPFVSRAPAIAGCSSRGSLLGSMSSSAVGASPPKWVCTSQSPGITKGMEKVLWAAFVYFEGTSCSGPTQAMSLFSITRAADFTGSPSPGINRPALIMV
ncbi:hypothetical protein RRF57_009986 [Xylaria bambusicola]|uniref:Uncharacterized protein n=1 Tax=Xylaria bambusicola TaxID=326684 RepID=A0AAN7URS8_9PEZI